MKKRSMTIFTAKARRREGEQRNRSWGSFVRLSWRLGVLAVTLLLPSCFGLDKDMGFTQVPDLQARQGPAGTMDDPAPLDPFKTYDLVLAANETRVFSLKVPSKWFWKISLTVANREETRRGQLSADILPKEAHWSVLPGTYLDKDFDLGREGLGVVLGVGNPGDTRIALLQLTQQGAPLHVTLTSEISATRALVVPNSTPLPEKDP